MLLIGFLLLLAHGALSKEHAGATVAWGDERLPKQDTFSHRQVLDAMYQVAFAARVKFPDVAIPATIMLCGAALLDLARRREKQKSNAP